MGISLDDDEWEFEPDNTNDSYLFHCHDTRLGIHLAQRMNEWLALGIALRRYGSAPKQLSPVRENTDVNAVIWDLALSLHGKHRAASIGRPSDEFHYGITIDNLLGTEIWYRDENLKDPITQEARLAAAYFWNPEMGHVLRANVLSVLLTVESSLQGTKHEFRNWGTLDGAAELRILEVFMLSAGIENIVRLGNRYRYWPEYPVLRYGAGLDIPLDRLFDLDVPFEIQIDYAHTMWNSLAEENLNWDPNDNPQQVNALSLQLRADFF